MRASGSQTSPISAGCGPGDRLDVELAADEEMVIDGGAVGAQRRSLGESGDGGQPLDMAEGLARRPADGPVDGGVAASRVGPGEEELETVGGDRRRVGEHPPLVDGPEDPGGSRVESEGASG